MGIDKKLEWTIKEHRERLLRHHPQTAVGIAAMLCDRMRKSLEQDMRVHPKRYLKVTLPMPLHYVTITIPLESTKDE